VDVPPKTLRETKPEILRADSLSAIPWLIHGFSTRIGGLSRVYGGKTLNLGFTQHDSRQAVQRNRGAFVRQLGVFDQKHPWPQVTIRQIHSDLIHCVSQAASGLVGDGLITQTPGILLTILTADCLPVVLADIKRRAVGVFHAGWRGTVKRMVEKGVGEMRHCFGTSPRDLRAAIGPGVQSCCYEVGAELRTQFESQFAYADKLFHEVKESDPVREKYPLLFLTARAPGHGDLLKKIFLDLVEANRRQLIAAGVAARNISASPLCTSCRTDLLFSHRAEKGVTGRMMAVAGIRAET
jgi:purine-nucleoside/S-methyl-5'-thioadenosine phosphorylase / adenosine deaminase